MEKETKKLSNTDWIAISILALGIIGMVGLPYLITKQSWLYDLGVKDANEIGDTLGGILGPFISLISAGLIYLTLREQIKANKLINDQFNIDRKNKSESFILEESIKMLNDIEKKLENIEYKPNKHVEYYGKDAVIQICMAIIGSEVIKDKKKDIFLETQMIYLDEPVELIKNNIKDFYRFSIFVIRYRSFLEKYFPIYWEELTKATKDILFDYNNCRNTKFFARFITIHQNSRTLFETLYKLKSPNLTNFDLIKQPNWDNLKKIQKEYERVLHSKD